MIECLLGVLPAVLLAISLFLGCYPGEEIIVHLSRRSQAGPRGPVALAIRRRRPGGGDGTALRLLASSRPLRGPPSLALAQS